MRQTDGTRRSASEKLVKDIKRATRKQYLSEVRILEYLATHFDNIRPPVVRCVEAHCFSVS